MSDEPAPYALGLRLHRALAVALLDNLKGSPSADMLHCARSFLRDQHITPDTDKDRKALRQLLALYVQALHSALTEGNPSASMLREVGDFLHRSGTFQGLGGRVETIRAVRELTDLDLPFAS